MECTSVKTLLKQVYIAHISKVKALEEENKELKVKLRETEEKLHENVSNCKRCVELEEAFKSCKTALHEQTKRLENIGQKFSVFSGLESTGKSTELSNNDESKTAHDQSKCRVLDVVQDLNSKTDNEDIITPSPLKFDKSIVTSSKAKQNLLKNIINDQGQGSLDLSCTYFPVNLEQSNSCVPTDSLILAPDTLDVVKDANKSMCANSVPKIIVQSDGLSNISVITNEELSGALEICKDVRDNHQKLKVAKKRPCNDSSFTGQSFKKSNVIALKEKLQTEAESKEKNTVLIPKKSASDNFKTAARCSENTSFVTSLKSGKENEGEIKSNNSFMDKMNKSESLINDKKDKNVLKSEKSARNYINKDELSKDKDSFCHISPSLIPGTKKEVKSVLNNVANVSNDEDFEISLNKKKERENESSWKACDKKKLLKKVCSVKPIKTTSKYKLTLDAPPPNYKKPTFRQTKLSKSVFLPKISPNISNEEFIVCDENEKENSSNHQSNSTSLHVDVQTPSITDKFINGTELDATCVPGNYQYEVIASGKAKNKETEENKKVFDESVLVLKVNFSDDSSDLIIEENKSNHEQVTTDSTNLKICKKDKAENSSCSDNEENVDILNSFDRLPVAPEPNYKYKEATIRQKEKRKQLNGFDCKMCEKYYTDLGLSDKEKKERLKKCSRHRGKFEPPPTPEHFWELDFPDTQECKARGYLNETQKVTLKSHRRRPL
ncbi:DNA endonuclease RBBP8, partial [Stegodyphus mimosarum]